MLRLSGKGSDSVIIGFGFGDPIQAILMVLVTSVLSYVIFKNLRAQRRRNLDPYEEKERLRQYYLEQRQRAREYAREFDLTDEEIERRIDEELNK